MIYNKLSATAIAVAGLGLVSSTVCEAAEIASPSGLVKVNADVVEGVPTYSVTFKGKDIIKPSTLGFELADGPDMMDGFKLLSAETSSFDETWEPVWGENREIRNHYNELLLRLDQPEHYRRMNLRFRVYDDGLDSAMSSPTKECSHTLSSRRSIPSLPWRETILRGG